MPALPSMTPGLVRGSCAPVLPGSGGRNCRWARQALLERFGATTDPYIAERVSRACLLLPPTDDELRKAAALADKAAAAKGSVPNWIYRYFLFAKGLAEFRQGRMESAMALMNGEASRVMGPSPHVVAVMETSIEQGRKEQARKIAPQSHRWFRLAPLRSRQPGCLHFPYLPPRSRSHDPAKPVGILGRKIVACWIAPK